MLKDKEHRLLGKMTSPCPTPNSPFEHSIQVNIPNTNGFLVCTFFSDKHLNIFRPYRKNQESEKSFPKQTCTFSKSKGTGTQACLTAYAVSNPNTKRPWIHYQEDHNVKSKDSNTELCN